MTTRVDIEIQGREITIFGRNAERLAKSPKFVGWLERWIMLSVSSSVKMEAVFEEWSWWSKKDDQLKLGVFAIQYRKNNALNAGLLFFRSDSVAVFLVLIDAKTQQRFVVLVKQMRNPVGCEILEIPAGSIEDDGDPVKTIKREVWEEVGLEIQELDLLWLGTYYFSPGACNERISLFCYDLVLSGKEIDALQGRFAGLKSEGEHIQVVITPLEALQNADIRDAKTRLSFFLYKDKKGLK